LLLTCVFNAILLASVPSKKVFIPRPARRPDESCPKVN
jgi:hypothetical protein